MQSSRRRGRTTDRTRLALACAPLADDLESWLIREVEDFEHLTPVQSLVLDAWAVLTLAAERGVDLEHGKVSAPNVGPSEFDPETAGAARTRDALAAPVVVDARRRDTPPSASVPATGWSSPQMPPAGGWTTHPVVDAPPKGASGGVVR